MLPDLTDGKLATLICVLVPFMAMFLLTHRVWPLTENPKSSTPRWSNAGLRGWSFVVVSVVIAATLVFCSVRYIRLDRMDAAISTVAFDDRNLPLPMNLFERCLNATIFGWSLFFCPVLLLGSYRVGSKRLLAFNALLILEFAFAIWLLLAPGVIAAT